MHERHAKTYTSEHALIKKKSLFIRTGALSVSARVRRMRVWLQAAQEEAMRVYQMRQKAQAQGSPAVVNVNEIIKKAEDKVIASTHAHTLTLHKHSVRHALCVLLISRFWNPRKKCRLWLTPWLNASASRLPRQHAAA
jgi:hypothetical protein